MLARPIYGWVVLGTMLLGTQSALTHHSVSANFDRNAPREITGTVTAFHLINPHSRLEVEVIQEDGAVG